MSLGVLDHDGGRFRGRVCTSGRHVEQRIHVVDRTGHRAACPGEYPRDRVVRAVLARAADNNAQRAGCNRAGPNWGRTAR